MITIDKLESKIEKFIDKLKALDYPFIDDSISSEAERAKEDAIQALEAFLELAQTDVETSAETKPAEEEDDA